MRQDVEQLKVGTERNAPARAAAHGTEGKVTLHVRQPAERRHKPESDTCWRLEEELMTGAYLEPARRGQVEDLGRLPGALRERLLDVDTRARLEGLAREGAVCHRRRTDVHDVHRRSRQHLAQRIEPGRAGDEHEQPLASHL